MPKSSKTAEKVFMLMKLKMEAIASVMPTAKPRVLCGYISATIANGSVKNPIVPEKMKAKRKTAGSHVKLKGKAEQTASPSMLKNIPMDETIVRGFLPNLSEAKAIKAVVTHLMAPMTTALRNSSMATPASIENCDA